MPETNIEHFTDPKEYQRKVHDYLIGNEAENNLPFGILSNVISGEYSEKTPYLGIVKEDKQICLVVMCTPPFPVLFSYQPVPPDRRILSTVIQDLIDVLGEDFTGVTANKELAAELCDILEKEAGQKTKLRTSMRIYKLDKVNPAPDVPGIMRSTTYEDEDLLQGWFANFYRDTLGEVPDPEHIRDQVSRHLDADAGQRGLMLWEIDSKPVSMAGYSGPTPHGMRVGAVYTPPDQRRNGYASACTAGLSQYLLDRGFSYCFLFTDLTNPTSNHIYQEIGYREICDVNRFDFDNN